MGGSSMTRSHGRDPPSLMLVICQNHKPRLPPRTVSGIENQQTQQLLKLQATGVQWTHPEDKSWSVFRLSHGGDGNCLFTASRKAMASELKVDARNLSMRTVNRFLEDLGSLSGKEREND
ncbi:hypothetical protein Ancab_018255 [Ancistrocladus abbreviatus]